ncbi:hypothetical protein [Algibacter mikhailovii]|uniref:hypothetical protein n=1 Tax=Algibacter mikhailovii TaxID=425498 RepID=UPI002493F811|nr:hypothetical protein [Algibacter mikhailovii]
MCSSNELPTNDNELIDYVNVVKGIKREQINYIEYYWKGRFIKETNRFDKSKFIKV